MSLGALLFILSVLASLSQAQDTVQRVEKGRQNSPQQQEKSYLILISADGFRYDYAEKFKAKNLLALRSQGVQAQSMQPSYPCVTFSNHYSLATGMYPSHHGLVNNSFYDPKKKKIYTRHDPSALQDSTWYGGVPIWVLAEQQQMLAATFYWVGSETAVKGWRPSYWYAYNTQINLDARLQTVKEWLNKPAEQRPHLIAFYFPEVDMAAHRYGAESEQVAKAVTLVDEYVGKMVDMTNKTGLNINYVFVSDHGMVDVDTKATLSLPKAVDSAKFVIPNSDVILQLYAKDPSVVQETYLQLKKEAKDFEVFLPEETPAHWHFRGSDNKDGRIGDIIITPNYPKVFNLSGKAIPIGKHGYDNKMPQMQASFYAWGPAFKQGLKIAPFENVHVYPLLAKLLGLDYNFSIDGNLEVLQGILK